MQETKMFWTPENVASAEGSIAWLHEQVGKELPPAARYWLADALSKLRMARDEVENPREVANDPEYLAALAAGHPGWSTDAEDS